MTAAKFGAVGGLGFLTDISLFHAGLALGLSSLVARLISLIGAMQVTFLINGLLVFRCLTWRTGPRHWSTYMTTNGFGNACNWLIFAGLITSHAPFVSRHAPALVIGSAAAYGINYIAVRLLVFGRPQVGGGPVRQPQVAETEPGSAAPF